jgi:hypothetical protein
MKFSKVPPGVPGIRALELQDKKPWGRDARLFTALAAE